MRPGTFAETIRRRSLVLVSRIRGTFRPLNGLLKERDRLACAASTYFRDRSSRGSAVRRRGGIKVTERADTIARRGAVARADWSGIVRAAGYRELRPTALADCDYDTITPPWKNRRRESGAPIASLLDYTRDKRHNAVLAPHTGSPHSRWLLRRGHEMRTISRQSDSRARAVGSTRIKERADTARGARSRLARRAPWVNAARRLPTRAFLLADLPQCCAAWPRPSSSARACRAACHSAGEPLRSASPVALSRASLVYIEERERETHRTFVSGKNPGIPRTRECRFNPRPPQEVSTFSMHV